MQKIIVPVLAMLLGATVTFAVYRSGGVPWPGFSHERAAPAPAVSPPAAVLGTGGAPPPEAPRTAQEARSKGWDLLHGGHWRQAQDAFLEILSGNSKDADAMNGLVAARRYMAGDDPDVLRRQAARYQSAIAQGVETDEHYTRRAMEELVAANARAVQEIEASRESALPGGRSAADARTLQPAAASPDKNRRSVKPSPFSTPSAKPLVPSPSSRAAGVKPSSSAATAAKPAAPETLHPQPGKPATGGPPAAKPAAPAATAAPPVAAPKGPERPATPTAARAPQSPAASAPQAQTPAPAASPPPPPAPSTPRTPPAAASAPPALTPAPQTPPPAAATPRPSPPPAASAPSSPPATSASQAPPPAAESAAAPNRLYTVRVGPLSDRERAAALARQLSAGGFPSASVTNRTAFQVVSEPLPRSVAEGLVPTLAGRGIRSQVEPLAGDTAQLLFGSFASQKEAETFSQHVGAQGYDAWVRQATVYTVQLGPYPQSSVTAISGIVKSGAPDAAVSVDPVP